MDLAWHEYLLWRDNGWTINDPVAVAGRRVTSIVPVSISPRKRPDGAVVLSIGYSKDEPDLRDGIFYGNQQPFRLAELRHPETIPGQRSHLSEAHPGPLRLTGGTAILRVAGTHRILINCRKTDGKRYVCLLAGNQNGKVCVQEFLVYRQGGKFITRPAGERFLPSKALFSQGVRFESPGRKKRSNIVPRGIRSKNLLKPLK